MAPVDIDDEVRRRESERARDASTFDRSIRTAVPFCFLTFDDDGNLVQCSLTLLVISELNTRYLQPCDPSAAVKVSLVSQIHLTRRC